MFKKIMVPVDLGHLDKLARALDAAGGLAKTHGAEIVYVGVFGNVPSAAAPGPQEYKSKLEDFAAREAGRHGVSASADPVFSHDPEAELGSALLSAIKDTGSDVVVMASHVPGWAEHVFHSNAGYIACHAEVSVFIVR